MDAIITLPGLLLSEIAAFTSGALGVLVFNNLRQRRETQSRRRRHDGDTLAALLDQASDALLCFDETLGCIFASAATDRLFGLSPSDLIGRQLLSLTSEDPSPIEAAVARARSGQLGAEAVFRIARPSGDQFWIEARLGAADEEGRIVMALRDVSTRKTAELALRVANLELNKLAGSDSLTGLANRRRFDQALDTECRRASRSLKPVSLLLLDVDRFKGFNDRYGHQAGDACLKQIGGALRALSSRTSDLAARFGGEEFALMVPGADEDSAANIAERARQSIANLTISHEGNPEAGGIVTVSVGWATAYPRPDALDGDGTSLIANADRALYDAKRLGRNRVMASAAEAGGGTTTGRLIADAARLARLDAIRAAGAFDPSPNLHRISRMAAVLLGMPIAFVALLDRDEAAIIGHHGFGETPPHVPHALCARLLGTCGAQVVPGTETDPESQLFTTEHRIAFRAAVPLFSGDDLQHIGGLWVADRQPRPDLDEPRRLLLSRLAGLVVEDIEARRSPNLSTKVA